MNAVEKIEYLKRMNENTEKYINAFKIAIIKESENK